MSFRKMLARALAMPMFLFAMVFCFVVPSHVLGLDTVEAKRTQISPQEFAALQVDPSNWPECVSIHDWPSGQIPSAFITVDAVGNGAVRKMSFDRAFAASQAGQVWIVMACS